MENKRSIDDLIARCDELVAEHDELERESNRYQLILKLEQMLLETELQHRAKMLELERERQGILKWKELHGKWSDSIIAYEKTLDRISELQQSKPTIVISLRFLKILAFKQKQEMRLRGYLCKKAAGEIDLVATQERIDSLRNRLSELGIDISVAA